MLLFDEIEAAGVDIFGQIEEKMRLKVPLANSVSEGLGGRQHAQRHSRRAFAGVNVLVFGDFWQLDPTGSKSFMSNPCDITGEAHVDSMMSMFWNDSSEEQAATCYYYYKED